MINTYPQAYKEVLILLKYYLKEEDYNKIPKEKIEFFEKNADKNYSYEIDKTKKYEEQKRSRKTNSIIVTLYRDYFTTDEEKKTLEKILKLNELKVKNMKKEMTEKVQNELKIEEEKIVTKETKEDLHPIEKNVNIFKRIWSYFRRICGGK